ncbi:MAG: hypothetical protein WC184_13140 [Acidimicrobiia bacterium]
MSVEERLQVSVGARVGNAYERAGVDGAACGGNEHVLPGVGGVCWHRGFDACGAPRGDAGRHSADRKRAFSRAEAGARDRERLAPGGYFRRHGADGGRAGSGAGLRAARAGATAAFQL